MAQRPTSNNSNLSSKKLGRILVDQELITEDELLKAFDYQNLHGGSIKDSVLKLNFVTEDDLIGVIAGDLGVSFLSLEGYTIDPDILQLVSGDLARRNKLVPVSLAGKTLTVVMSDPLDMVLLDTLNATTGFEIIPAIARETEITEAIERSYEEVQKLEAEKEAERDAQSELDKSSSVADAVAAEYAEELAGAEMVDVSDLANEQSAPIIQLSVQIIQDAYDKGASDIHIEPFEEETIVRNRIDGVLQVHLRLPRNAIRAIVSRYKIMSELDIAEHRQPQDGRIRFKQFSPKGTDIDLRVSTVPVAFGEKIVMRILDKQSAVIGLGQMGFSEENLTKYRECIQIPYGMILNVGPTGSGKTTTLYAALTEINRPELNIQTAEDPVEYMLKGINQSQMHHDIGYNFSKALRAFLRQDPDVIMVGEIRDIETATIAVEAALTGHLMFSTLHTNDAVGTIIRITEMGVEPFLISSALLLVCAQRLMRRLCKCKIPHELTESEEQTFLSYGIDTDDLTTFQANGCDICGGTGYKGRTGSHEVLTLTPELREVINKKKGDEEMRTAALNAGMIPIFQDAISKAANGSTSFEEAVRVVREN